MAKVKFTIDGQPVECEEGTMVLQAALDNGVFIPHYCYHPALSVAGNCRMCMIEIAVDGPPRGPQKPAISCATVAAEGMKVLTKSKMAVEARTGVLESLLVNHPLDCPVCDQAGECDLQDFSFGHGQPASRFREEKEVKHTKDLGPEVRLYGNRCINCTRCVRFTQEISGTSEIVQVSRGGRNVVDTFPGTSFESPLSGNVVDICPVGALVSRDFLHKARVWQLDTHASVCPGCATGCSIEVHTRDEEIMRLKPRHNPKVNGWWMCDEGRLGYKPFVAKDRLAAYRTSCDEGKEAVSFHAAVEELAAEMKAAGDAVYAIASPWLTSEELFSLAALVPSERIALLGRADGKERRFFPSFGDSERNPSLPLQQSRGKLFADGATFAIDADKNPNRKAAEAILGAEACSKKRLDAVLAKAQKGEAKVLLVFLGMPDFAAPRELTEAVKGCEYAALIDLFPSKLADTADMSLPGAAPFEKEGTYMNGRGTIQRLSASRPTVGQARTELELIYALGKKLGKTMPGHTPRRVFEALAETVAAFKGATWEGVGPEGQSWSPHQAAARKDGLRRLPMHPKPVVLEEAGLVETKA